MISMKTIFHFTLIIVYSWNSIVNAEETTIYKYEVINTESVTVKMENFKGNVLIFVNVPTMYSDTADSRNLMNLAKEFSKAEVQFFAFIYGVPIIQHTNSDGSTFKDVINKANNENTCKIELFDNCIINGFSAHELWQYMNIKHNKINSYEMFIVSKYGYVADRVAATTEYQVIKEKIMNQLEMWKKKESVHEFNVTEINNKSKSMRDYQDNVLFVFKLNSTTAMTENFAAIYSTFVELANKTIHLGIQFLVFLFGVPTVKDSDIKSKIKNVFNVFRLDLYTSELWKHMISKTSSEKLIPEYTAFIIDGSGQVNKRIDVDKSVDITLLKTLARDARAKKREQIP